MLRFKLVRHATLSVFVTLFLAATGWAVPTINNVQGTLQNGQNIVVRGSGFGNGPNIKIFDDFESGKTGGLIPTGQTVVGAWSEFGSNHPFYTDTASISGSKSLRTDNSRGYSIYAGVNFPSTTEVFASWWMYLPPGTNIPGDGTTSGRNWKVTWVQGSSTTDDDHTLPTILATSNRIGSNAGAYNQYVNFPFKVGEWLRVSAWINAGTPGQSNGAVRFTTLNSSGSVDQVNVSNVKVLPAGGSYERVRFNGYGRQTPNSFPTFDDVYAAVGPNAQARIEIGNASRYAACSKLAIITPTSWTSTEIAATVRDGAFKPGDQIYVFIVDANGNVSSGNGPFIYGNIVGDGTVPPAPTDNVPSIAITTPSSTGSFITADPQVSIAGHSSDDLGISSITWAADLGGSGLADNLSGDWTSWGINNLSLAEGDNIITVTTTDTIGQTASQVIRITQNSTVPGPEPTPPGVKSWNANTQTGDPVWKNSSVTYTVRVLVNGDLITQGGSQVSLGFQGRSAESYTIRKVSISERDINAPTGNVVDSTWTRVTFNGSSTATWGTDVITVPAGQSTFSDPVDFPFHAGKDYYVTFKIDTPSVYLNPPTGYQELYFQNVDRTDDVDWAGNGHSVTQDFHALQSIFVDGPVPVRLSPPTGLRIVSSY